MKLYIQELGTERMLRLASATPSHTFAVLSLAQAELRSAIRRRQRAGDLGQEADDRLRDFEVHLRSIFLRQAVNDPVVDLACRLLDEHALKSYDALQLAGCLMLRSAVKDDPVFVCADRQLLAAAESNGLLSLDPAG